MKNVRSLLAHVFSTVFKTIPSLPKDFYAGLSVGIVALPLAIAFAIASGVRPEQGIFTAIIASLIVGIFGGARFQISGPTGTLIVFLSLTTQRFGFEGLVMTTALAALILITMGCLGFGALIKFIPYPLTVGFTSGLGILLLTRQIPDVLGLPNTTLPQDFLSRLLSIAQHILELNPYSVAVGILTIAIILLSPRWVKFVPGALIAIVLTSLLVNLFHIPAVTLNDQFGEISRYIPHFQLPFFEFKLFLEIIPSAIALSLLIAIESIMSAIVIDGMKGTKHNTNKELIAHGLANLGNALFQGMPAAGSISRSATNIKSGAETRMAAIFSAGILAIFLMLFGKWIGSIPVACLAGILILLAYNLCDYRHFTKLLRSPKRDVSVLLITFFLTVFVDLITALEVGLILATFLFVNDAAKTSRSYFLNEVRKEEEREYESYTGLEGATIHPDIEIFEIFGPLFFAAADKFKTALSQIHRNPKVLIIRLRYVPSIDATGIHAIESILAKAKKKNTLLLLSGVSRDLRQILKKSGFLEKIDPGCIFNNIYSALEKANAHCEPPPLPQEEPAPTVEESLDIPGND